MECPAPYNAPTAVFNALVTELYLHTTYRPGPNSAFPGESRNPYVQALDLILRRGPQNWICLMSLNR